jgi:hypothetical protein
MEKFTIGTLPEFPSTKGWWTGRCYAPESPVSPDPMLLAVVENTIVHNPNDGPDFPPTSEIVHNLVFITDVNGVSPPNFFDDMSSDTRNAVASVVGSDLIKSLVIFEANGSLNSETGEIRFSIRKQGDNFYGTVNQTNSAGETKTIRACYFFKKVD